MGYQLLKKGKYKQLSNHLNQREFDCKCNYPNCNSTLVYDLTVSSFEKLRTSCGNKSIILNSAFRCQLHNKDVGGIDNSEHMNGSAIDPRPPRGICIEEFGYRASKCFDVAIIYKEKNFVHCHNKSFKK